MENVPESAAALELLQWIGHARDAAWATKLAILRLARREDIERFGAFLAEHDRHTAELAQLLRTPTLEPKSPTSRPFSRGTRTSSAGSWTPTR
jgi:hypothetical protein